MGTFMKRLRKEYDKKEPSDVWYWLYQMYSFSLKSKSLNESMAVKKKIEENNKILNFNGYIVIDYEKN